MAGSHCRHTMCSSEPQCLRPSAVRGRSWACGATNGRLSREAAPGPRGDGRAASRAWCGMPAAARASASLRVSARSAGGRVWYRSGGRPGAGRASGSPGASRIRALAPPTRTAGEPGRPAGRAGRLRAGNERRIRERAIHRARYPPAWRRSLRGRVQRAPRTDRTLVRAAGLGGVVPEGRSRWPGSGGDVRAGGCGRTA